MSKNYSFRIKDSNFAMLLAKNKNPNGNDIKY